MRPPDQEVAPAWQNKSREKGERYFWPLVDRIRNSIYVTFTPFSAK